MVVFGHVGVNRRVIALVYLDVGGSQCCRFDHSVVDRETFAFGVAKDRFELAEVGLMRCQLKRVAHQVKSKGWPRWPISAGPLSVRQRITHFKGNHAVVSRRIVYLAIDLELVEIISTIFEIDLVLQTILGQSLDWRDRCASCHTPETFHDREALNRAPIESRNCST